MKECTECRFNSEIKPVKKKLTYFQTWRNLLELISQLEIDAFMLK